MVTEKDAQTTAMTLINTLLAGIFLAPLLQAWLLLCDFASNHLAQLCLYLQPFTGILMRQSGGHVACKWTWQGS